MIEAATTTACALLLVLLSVCIETSILRRSIGLRSRRTALWLASPVADGVRLLAKRPPSGEGRYIPSVCVALVPSLLMLAALPTGAGLGGVLASNPSLLVGLLALAPFALFVPARHEDRHRQQPLLHAAPALLACGCVFLLAGTAQQLGTDHPATIFTRSFTQWPLWNHPLGAVATLLTSAVLGRLLHRALGGAALSAPGIAYRPGVGGVLLRMSRPLLLGSCAALACHLYLGTAPWPDATLWAGLFVWLMAIAVGQAALADADIPMLSRCIWKTALPLALADVAWHIARTSGVLPWN